MEDSTRSPQDSPPQEVPTNTNDTATDLGRAEAQLPVFSVERTPERLQEERRGQIAIILTLLFVFLIFASFLTLWIDAGRVEKLTPLMQIMLPAVTTLLGTVVGFYYGAKSKRE